jgi:hypothetical protein
VENFKTIQKVHEAVLSICFQYAVKRNFITKLALTLKLKVVPEHNLSSKESHLDQFV